MATRMLPVPQWWCVYSNDANVDLYSRSLITGHFCNENWKYVEGWDSLTIMMQNEKLFSNKRHLPLSFAGVLGTAAPSVDLVLEMFGTASHLMLSRDPPYPCGSTRSRDTSVV